MMLTIVRISEETRPFVTAQIIESWGAELVVSRGVSHDTRMLDGFAAIADGAVAGYALYNIVENDCELVVLEALNSGHGIGSALIDEVLIAAKENGCRRVWLITTNDNTSAIRFYQRFGFDLREVHINAMEQARLLKPQIPMLGNDDIPIKHEFEFEIMLS